MKRADWFSFLFVIILALLLLFLPLPRYAPVYVTIQTADSTYRYPLAEDRTISIESNGICMTVQISNATVCVQASDCPDSVCVHTGEAKEYGDTILCAPACVLIKITAKESDLDGTVY